MGINKILVMGNNEISHSILRALIKSLEKVVDIPQKPYEIFILTYPSQTVQIPPHAPPTIIKHYSCDFSDASLRDALSGTDLVVSTIAGGDHVFQTRIIDAAIAAGVKRFMPCEFGQNSLNDKLHQRVPRYVERAKIIEYLQHSSRTQQDFTWVALAVGSILDSALLSGDLGFDLEWQSATMHGSGEERFAASSLDSTGHAVSSIVRHWTTVQNQYLCSAGTITTSHEILRCLQSRSQSRWTAGYSDIEDCVREGMSRIERGFPDSGMFLLEKSILCDQELGAVHAFEDHTAARLLQLNSETTESIVGKAYWKFTLQGKPHCGCD
ncbi:hypothetical protein B0J11DRAFT_501942 [Dendryphion nanum]|uniref:NmrA-like domain-containing protein n=1 Tax=Dendryphion nanum TaxID=256645 RepID=A0A9P9IVI6_9PLEO|nr:hypothetical protein B0J11DRAFT_501942 [Dendryphion nanum]